MSDSYFRGRSCKNKLVFGFLERDLAEITSLTNCRAKTALETFGAAKSALGIDCDRKIKF